MSGFLVDVHTHLTHEQFVPDLPEVILRAQAAGLGAIVVNGLGPQSNRQILQLAQNYPVVKSALGIYPVEAVNEQLAMDFPGHCERFSVRDEIAFIDRMASVKKILAIGECGLDGYLIGEETFEKQEEVFVALLDIAIREDLPVIVHSRKREGRVLELLANLKVKKGNLHCYSGKLKPAIQAAEQWGWCFSIPANIHRSQSFQLLAQKLPEHCVLTETDAPYLSPEPGTRNEPANVLKTIQLIAKLRGWDQERAIQTLWENYLNLFSARNGFNS